MTFLVRQISRTADGREIIRPYSYSAGTIFVGRDAACEIHIADLAAGLRHASITALDSGHIEIASTGGLGFGVDGRTVKKVRIDPANGGELRFGSHVLKIAREDGIVTIAAEREAEMPGPGIDDEAAGLFTLRGLLPGRRISAWAFLILILAAFLAWPIHSFYQHQTAERDSAPFRADTFWSSGKLSTAHASLENNCKACHTEAFVAVQDLSCASCHKDVHNHADPTRLKTAKGPLDWDRTLLRDIGLKFNRPAGRCVECHTEHEGAGPMQATSQQFCTACHADMNTRLIGTKISNAEDFGTAHPQFKPLVATAAGLPPTMQRISLDKKPADDSGLKFPHDMHLSRSNGVARMAQRLGSEYGFGSTLTCNDCHTNTADGVRFFPVTMEKNCAMCHSLGLEKIGDTVRTLRHGDPKLVVADIRAFYGSGGPFRAKSPPVIEGRRRPGDFAVSRPYFAYFGSVNYGRADGAVRAIFSKGGMCYDCHTISAPPAGSDNWGVQAVHQSMRYMQKGWFDHGAHKTETCASCHKAGVSSQAADLLLPGIATCRGCHGGEASRADVPSRCAMCHSYHVGDGAPWVPSHREYPGRKKGTRPDILALRREE
jgi:predicted CXXCH cytochrome family protein